MRHESAIDSDQSERAPAREHVLVVEVGDRRCAVAVETVRHVVRSVAIRTVAGVPRIVDGVIDVRGSIIPVLDLRQHFGLIAIPVSLTQHFVIVENRRRLLALRVDRAVDVIESAPRALEQAHRSRAAKAVAPGVIRTGDGLLLLHDFDRLLGPAEAELLYADGTST